MNPRRLAVLLVLLITCGAGYALIGQRNGQKGETALGKGRTLGKAVTYGNLSLFPVYDSSAKPSNRYMTLDEGLKAKTVRVREKQGGGEVSSVLVTNKSKKPLYLMSGEVVLGGQQDRIIGDDTIVPPQAKNLPVRVYCVEHGRWSGPGAFEESAKSVAMPSVRNTAQEGAFMAAVAERPAGDSRIVVSGMAYRGFHAEARGTSGKAQEEVWDKVAAKNKAFKSESATGTYRGVVNMESGEAAKSAKPYVSAITGRFPQSPKLVGAVAAVNGKVIAADIFGDPTLFRKLWPKLLRSYAAEAAESGPVKSPARAVSSGEAAKFVRSATESNQKTETRTSVVSNERYDSRDARAYRTKDRVWIGNGAGAAAPVHESVIRK